MINYPESLPLPLMRGNTKQDKPNSFLFESHADAPIRRTVDNSGWVRFAVTWSFNEYEISLFNQFYSDTINNGSSKFRIKIRDLSDFLGLYEVNFDTHYSVNISGARYTVSASVIGVFIERVYPDPLPVIPVFPFVWSSTEKAPDQFFEIINTGTLRVKEVNQSTSLQWKFCFIEQQNIVNHFGGKLYMEIYIGNVTPSDDFPLNIVIYPTTGFPQYEYSSLPLDSDINMEFSGAAGGRRFRLRGFGSTDPIDTPQVDPWTDKIIMVALDFTVSNQIRAWVGADGVWNSGDPSTDDSPQAVWGLGGHDWLNGPTRAAAIPRFVSRAGNPEPDFKIYGGPDLPFNYDVPTGYNGT